MLHFTLTFKTTGHQPVPGGSMPGTAGFWIYCPQPPLLSRFITPNSDH